MENQATQGTGRGGQEIPADAIPPVLPGGIHMPSAAQPPIDQQTLEDGRRALDDLPTYDGSGSWKVFAVEFSVWLDAYDIYRCGDDFMKKALLYCFKGNTLTLIANHRTGSQSYAKHPYFWQYAKFIQGLFAPEQEGQLTESVF